MNKKLLSDFTQSLLFENNINACSTLDAFKALFVEPTDADGNITGNAPITDWPEEI